MGGYQVPPGVPYGEEPPDGPGAETQYLPVETGGATGLNGIPVTGAFFPQGCKYPDPIDIVLFFHGDKQGWTTIYDYWKPNNKHGIALREAFNQKSGRPMVLIAPTMGATPGASGGYTGILDGKGGADDYLDEVLSLISAIVSRYWNRATPKIGRLILAAHSGGGETMLRQTLLMKKYINNIVGIWGFDCTYNFSHSRPNADNYINFARFHGNVKIHLYYKLNTGPAGVAEEVAAMAAGKAPLPHKRMEKPMKQKLNNVFVTGSRQGHYEQLNANFPIRVAAEQ